MCTQAQGGKASGEMDGTDVCQEGTGGGRQKEEQAATVSERLYDAVRDEERKGEGRRLPAEPRVVRQSCRKIPELELIHFINILNTKFVITNFP